MSYPSFNRSTARFNPNDPNDSSEGKYAPNQEPAGTEHNKREYFCSKATKEDADEPKAKSAPVKDGEKETKPAATVPVEQKPKAPKVSSTDADEIEDGYKPLSGNFPETWMQVKGTVNMDKGSVTYLVGPKKDHSETGDYTWVKKVVFLRRENLSYFSTKEGGGKKIPANTGELTAKVGNTLVLKKKGDEDLGNVEILTPAVASGQLGDYDGARMSVVSDQNMFTILPALVDHFVGF